MDSTRVKTLSQNIGDGQIHMMHIRQRDGVPHRHAFFELVYIVGGSAEHHLENETVSLGAGDYFIIDPGSVHGYQETRNCEIVNCLFLPAYIDRALADCPSLASLLSNRILQFGVPVNIRAADRVLHDRDGSVGRLMSTMEQEYAAKRTGYMELLRCYLTQVLVCAVRECETAEKTRVAHSAIAEVTGYLKQNFARPLSLEALSERVGYAPQYLSSLFHRDTGMSIREFLQRLRMEEAARLLEQKNQKTSDVAVAVGYSDAKHFARVFRRYKGVSPREYRKHLQTL